MMPPFDPKFVLDIPYIAAASAYTIVTHPNPPLPDGYTLVGPIVAEPARVLARLAAATTSQQSMVHEMLADSYTFGLVAYNKSANTALVAFRGTENLQDWLADFDAVLINYEPVGNSGLVHMGFQLVYEQVRGTLPPLIAVGCAGCTRILVTGHSLGAALAVLSALDIAKNIPPNIVPELYTFAGPRTGNPTFANIFNGVIGTCYRVVNKLEIVPLDIVPNVPLPPLYQHVGQAENVNGGFTMDEAVAHSLPAYAAGLRKLL